jgi:hypothetical protein
VGVSTANTDQGGQSTHFLETRGQRGCGYSEHRSGRMKARTAWRQEGKGGMSTANTDERGFKDAQARDKETKGECE